MSFALRELLTVSGSTSPRYSHPHAADRPRFRVCRGRFRVHARSAKTGCAEQDQRSRKLAQNIRTQRASCCRDHKGSSTSQGLLAGDGLIWAWVG